MVRNALTCLALVIAAFFFIVSCQDPGSELPDDVVAVLDGKEIKLITFLSYLEGVVPTTDAGKQAKLSELLNNFIMADMAREKGYMDNPEVLSRVKVEKTKKLTEMLKEQIASQVDVALDELPDIEMKPGPSLDLYIIVLKDIEDAQLARKELDDGKEFEEVAKEYSIMPSSVAGGHMGLVYLPESDLSEGIRAMLNTLEVGEISPITKSQIGYAIFKVGGRVEAIELFEREQRALLSEIRQKRIEERINRLIVELRDQAQIEYNEEAIEAGGGGWYANVNGVPIGINIPEGLSEAEKMHMPHAFDKGEQLRHRVNRMINDLLLAEEAKRRGMNVSEDYLQFSLLTEDEILSEVMIQNEVWPKAVVTDEEVREYYDSHLDELQLKAKVALFRILVDDEDLANELKKELDEGEDFTHLAVKYSIDKTAAEGGYSGSIYKGHVIEPFNTVAFELNEGEHSGVLKTKYGYEIIMVARKRDAGPPKYEDIEPQLRKKLEKDKRAVLVMDFYKQARKGHELVVNKRLLKSL